MTIPPTKQRAHLDRGAWLVLAFVIIFVRRRVGNDRLRAGHARRWLANAL